MAVPTSNDVPGWESFSFDNVSAAGLQNVDVVVDADATVQSESNSSSAASADNVTGNSGASSLTSFNSGIQADETGTNTFDVSADAGLQGLAGTTAASSASTSKGVAKAFTELDESAGIQDVSSLEVGGELSALGQSINSLSADAGSVVGDSIGRSKMTDQVEGLEANDISVSSDAGIQGLAQLSNSASAATSDGDALSTAAAEKLQGADLDGLDVGGVASVIGQTTLSNTASSETVVEAENGLGAQATATLEQADGLRTSNNPLPDSAAGIEVSSDATLTGLASIDNSASAAATSGASTATAKATAVDGARINSTDIGGVGSITGQTNFTGSADAANVTDGNSTATASLNDADGLQGKDFINVSSDAGLTGLNAVDLTASAASTGSASAPTTASSTAEATTLQGAQLSDNTDIGGVGTIGGQVDFNGSAASSNVTGNADATGSLASLAQGLSTEVDSASGKFGTAISSDGTVQGFANLNTSADASTTAGEAKADATGANIDGAQLGDLRIGGIGTVAGSANFAAAANAANVTGGGADAANANAQVTTVDGLDSLSGDGIDISSDAGIQGLASIDLASAAQSTGATGAETTATATSGSVDNTTTLTGAELNSLTDIGGVGSIAGQVSLGSTADAANVTGMASGVGTINTAEGLDLNANLEVASDATVSGSAGISSSADASSTAGAATAESLSTTITGADLSGGLVDIGGIGSIAGQANFDLSASSSNVSKTSSAKADSAGATGLIGKETDGAFGIDVASDSGLSVWPSVHSQPCPVLLVKQSPRWCCDDNIGAELHRKLGNSNLTGAAQLDAAATASNVGAAGIQSKALAGQGLSVTGLTSGELGEKHPTLPDLSFGSVAEGNEITAPSFRDFNIDIASDSFLTAQAFSNLDATASTTAGNVLAGAGTKNNSDSDTTVTGIESGLDINVGGVSDLLAQAQGTVDAQATSVSGEAKAFGNTEGIGVNDLQMQVASDSDFSSSSTLIGDVDASTTEGLARAKVDLDSTGVEGIEMSIGGVNDFSSISSVTANSNASNVGAEGSDSTGDLDSSALTSAWIHSASDSDVSGIATIDGGISASSTAKAAAAEGDFDADGITDLQIGVGGMLDLAGQSQVSGDVSASSVSGAAEAASGANVNSATQSTAHTVWAYDIDASTVSGLKSIDIDVASDATILGTAFGDFSTTAESTGADATANAAQTMRGIEDLNLNLGGSGTINAIVSDTSYVSASSVSGNASATASVNAIGLDGGDIQIAGDATIVSSVSVESDAVASTVG